VYRYKHLEKAIENGEKLGFKDGAALYPMVTMNGEECHNEWEITFEEIHRNGAIAYAIYDFIRYTGQKEYLIDYGLEVLIGIARFWAQRVHWSEPKQQYVMHGVTGPNEFENNVNNNWYTNYIAVWCLKYAIEAIGYVKNHAPEKYKELEAKTKFYELTETGQWKEIIEKMYFPRDDQRDVFLQQEGFLDKELLRVDQIPDGQYPIHQHWSWDRVLRSCYIKQADVLQGMYFFEDHFDEDAVRRNFDFYEPMTVHESSLSPCVHAILAAGLGKKDKAYEMYLRTARLDLDDYNNDTKDGCHITSMAGTWMAVVKGFGGLRVFDDIIRFNPYIPEKWNSYSFKIRFRGHLIHIKVLKEQTLIANQSEQPLQLKVYNENYSIQPNGELSVPHKNF
jgi:maltose phosphorylase